MHLPVFISRDPLETTHRLKLSGSVRVSLNKAIETGTYAVSLFNADDRLIYCNDAFRKGWAIADRDNVTFASLIRHCFMTRQGAVIATDNVEDWLDQARLKRRAGPASRSFEIDLWDGRWIWLTEQRLEDGWILSVGQDITALKQSERMLRIAHDLAVAESRTDPLTRLPNRRCAMELLDRQVDQGEPFHVASIDVDSFKMINDRFGHVIGDDVLIQLSRELKDLEDAGCFVARLSGDEFLVVSQVDQSSQAYEAVLAGLLAQRARKSSTDESRLTFGISIGVATFPLHGADTRQLLSSADAAMYRAKAHGKSTLCFTKA